MTLTEETTGALSGCGRLQWSQHITPRIKARAQKQSTTRVVLAALAPLGIASARWRGSSTTLRNAPTAPSALLHARSLHPLVRSLDSERNHAPRGKRGALLAGVPGSAPLCAAQCKPCPGALRMDGKLTRSHRCGRRP